MIRVDQWIESSGAPIKMIMQVHDELVFEVLDKFTQEAIKEIRLHMTQASQLSVPLLVEIGAGKNWDEAH